MNDMPQSVWIAIVSSWQIISSSLSHFPFFDTLQIM